MIDREVRGVRVTHDGRGKISAGSGEAGKMKKLDYFNITAFSELIEIYGDKPTKILVRAPANNIEEFYNDAFELWGRPRDAAPDVKGTLKRTCTGKTAIYRTEQTVGGRKYAAGEEAPCACKALPPEVMSKRGRMVPNPEVCKYHCRVKFYACNPDTGNIIHALCYLFDTHSKNSGKAVFAELDKVEGRLRFVPFLISVKLVQDMKDIQKKFPVWQLELLGSIDTRMLEIPKDVARQLTQGSAEVIEEEAPAIEDEIPSETQQRQPSRQDPAVAASAKVRRTAEALIDKATKANIGSVRRYVDDRFAEGQLTESDHGALSARILERTSVIT